MRPGFLLLDLSSDTSGLTDGTITIIATTASETGKESATSTQATVTRDTAPPTVAIAGDTAVTVGGTVSLTLHPQLMQLVVAVLTADEVTASAGGTLTLTSMAVVTATQ